MSFELHYRSTGKGQPFVFQHGLGADSDQTHNLLAGLEGIRLISMDCRGHGRSPIKTDELPSFDHYADDVIRLLDHLEIDRAIFGGISMGAGISMNIADRFPDRVRALVLIRPAWLDRPNPENLKILLDVARFMEAPDGQEKFEELENFKKIKATLPNAAASILGQFSRTPVEAAQITLEQMVQDAPVASLTNLQRLDLPCLILVSSHDPLHPFEMGAAIGKNIRGSRQEEITSRYLDDAAYKREVRKLVSEFIDGLKPSV